ncbi:18973_t:CDS:2 [Dentiscutata erythropus]|uniref:18973_t:CDS:1 n=1 Tax=Dentiscutata erythropus TaxID=1348616 RepID=A0A9N9NVS4_9GLOM|nr:18973_t:CDS:2 [Dentiscutata erythropus]
MEPFMLFACIIISILCLQNIYVQVKRRAQILIWYSISNSIMSVSFVLAGIFLPNDFSLENASTFESVWCGISGLLYSLSSISNYGVALALSTELYMSLGFATPVTKRNDVKIRRLNFFLTVVIPIASIALSLTMLAVHHNPIFAVIDTGGICSVSRHSDYRIPLFFARTVPEFLPIYPACVLSVITVIPVARKVYRTYRFRETFALPWQPRISPKPSQIRSTRAGPPPNTASSSPKPTIPRNVLLRMASWCCLLLISGIPIATINLIENIHYVIYNVTYKIINNSFWDRNGVTLHMCVSMILFLLCFGTGEFATEQYGILWTKILGFICCSPSKIQSHQIEIEVVYTDFDMTSPNYSSSIPTSFIASPQVAYVRSTPIEYTYVTPPIDKKYLTGARAGWVPSKSVLCQQCQNPIKSNSTHNHPKTIRQTSLNEHSGISSQCTKQSSDISNAGSTSGQVLITIPEEAKLGS